MKINLINIIIAIVAGLLAAIFLSKWLFNGKNNREV